jgi:choline transport protein
MCNLNDLTSWKVEPRSTLPLIAIALTATITFLLSFIGLGSTVAFNDVVSLSINGLYTSYLLGNGLLLYRRMTGSILPYNAEDRSLRNTIEADQLTWGPWHIPEPFGTVINCVGCAYMVIMLFFSFWPVTMETTPESMNYSVLMTGVVVIFSFVYYFAWGNKDYKGPLVET